MADFKLPDSYRSGKTCANCSGCYYWPGYVFDSYFCNLYGSKVPANPDEIDDDKEAQKNPLVRSAMLRDWNEWSSCRRVSWCCTCDLWAEKKEKEDEKRNC